MAKKSGLAYDKAHLKRNSGVSWVTTGTITEIIRFHKNAIETVLQQDVEGMPVVELSTIKGQTTINGKPNVSLYLVGVNPKAVGLLDGDDHYLAPPCPPHCGLVSEED